MEKLNGNWLTRRPWILIILSFVLLAMALAVMLVIAFKTYPGTVAPPDDGIFGVEEGVAAPVVN